MKFINPETKTFKVFTALRNGESLTASEAKKRFGVGNLAADPAACANMALQFTPIHVLLAMVSR
jgi:hypothetical protein